MRGEFLVHEIIEKNLTWLLNIENLAELTFKLREAVVSDPVMSPDDRKDVTDAITRLQDIAAGQRSITEIANRELRKTIESFIK